MLSPASWQPLAERLSIQMDCKVRVDHDCGAGRTLTIRRDEQGLHAFCFRCNDHGWKPPEPEPLEVRLARLARVKQQDDQTRASTVLPVPAVRTWADWTPGARLWLLKAGLTSVDLPRLGAYYHPPSQRVVLPVLDGLGVPNFWQARALDGRQPKYLAPDQGKGQAVAHYGRSATITLTEDILSAYKVGSTEGCEGWSMLGTSISDYIIVCLLRRGCKVNVWLDPDPAGNRAATKVLKALRASGLEARKIVSKKDPKLLHREQIKELLCESA